jgi:hippurate hydrolase
MTLSASRPTTLESIREFHGDLIAIRHDLHAHPELGFEEVRTAGVIARSLQLLGIETHTGIGKTGVVGVIRGTRCDSGRSIGLRADMDALPMREENEFEYRSTAPQRMHGCGHDGHMTMLLGAARYLAATRRFNGTVNLIFQPGEEGFAGAKAMIEDGLFERFPCDSVYAMHNWPSLPPGTIGLNSGAMMAAADRFEITISGRGGHGAHPYLTIDPVVVAAHLITAAQSIVSRNVGPLESAVVSICAVEAGDLNAMSVIPREARLVGTVRSFKPAIQDLVEKRLGEIAHSVAAAFGATARLNYRRLYPATINSPEEAAFAGRVAASLVGPEHVFEDIEPSMGAEDFSFMLQKRPGAYLRLGQGGSESGCFLHNTRYDFNDAVIPLGSALFASLAEHALPVTEDEPVPIAIQQGET